MVAGGNDSGSRLEQLDTLFPTDTPPPRCVLPVNDSKVYGQFVLKLSQTFRECSAPGFSNDVSYKKYSDH